MVDSKKIGLVAGSAIVAAFVSQAAFAGSLTLDFDGFATGTVAGTSTYVPGEGFIVDSSLIAGVEISARETNLVSSAAGEAGSVLVGIATVFDSDINSAANFDPDLQDDTPTTSGAGTFSGGNNPNPGVVGNVLIIQDPSTRGNAANAGEGFAGCSTGQCNTADDSAAGGSLIIDFNQEIESVSFDFIDIQDGEAISLSLLDAAGSILETIASADFGTPDLSFGDNFFNSVDTINFSDPGVYGLAFNLIDASGAIDNVKVEFSAVPELDAAGLPITLSILGGLIALRAERRKKS